MNRVTKFRSRGLPAQRGCPILFEEKGGGRNLGLELGRRFTLHRQVYPPPFATRRMGHPPRIVISLPASFALGADAAFPYVAGCDYRI